MQRLYVASMAARSQGTELILMEFPFALAQSTHQRKKTMGQSAAGHLSKEEQRHGCRAGFALQAVTVVKIRIFLKYAVTGSADVASQQYWPDVPRDAMLLCIQTHNSLQSWQAAAGLAFVDNEQHRRLFAAQGRSAVPYAAEAVWARTGGAVQSSKPVQLFHMHSQI